MENAISWFEIFVTDLDRAVRFYQQVFAIDLRREEFFGSSIAIFPARDPGVAGALVSDGKRAPGAGGTVVYLKAEGKLDACLARVAGAGGTVVMPRTAIGPAGIIATLRDPDGNLVGLHSET